MATIKQWLIDAEFDWENGRIIFQELKKDPDDPSETLAYSPGWSDIEEVEQAIEIEKNHEILTLKFCNSFGSPECPRFMAEDNNAIYFPTQYDGATSLTKVYKLNYYLNNKSLTPYPGG